MPVRSVAQSCPTLCDPMDCNTPGSPVHHQLLGLAQTHVHWVSNAIQPSHPLRDEKVSYPFSSCLQSFPATGSFPMSQLFASGGQSIGASGSSSVLPMNIQDSFPVGWTGWISLLSKYSQESSPAPQFKCISSLALRLLYGPTLISMHGYWKNHSFDLCQQSDVSAFKYAV